MSGSKPMVVVVDDSEAMRKLVALELAQDGRVRVEQAASGEEGLQKAAASDCAVVVLDMMLPDIDGLQFIERLQELRPDPPSVIAMTGASQSIVPDSIIEGPYRGLVSAIFRKPFDHAKLLETILFCAFA